MVHQCAHRGVTSRYPRTDASKCLIGVDPLRILARFIVDTIAPIAGDRNIGNATNHVPRLQLAGEFGRKTGVQPGALQVYG